MGRISLNKALFFDIETHRVKNWNEISLPLQTAFINHYFDSEKYNTPKEHFNQASALHAEFSQIICIVFGYEDPVTKEFITTELHGTDEVEILMKTRVLLGSFQSAGYFLMGHNILKFDIPFLTKRYIINKINVPDFINSYGIKPWDQVHIDTIDLWKFGAWSNTSLETICATLGIPCKTDELGGKNLYTYDIKDMDWEQLVHYCKEDVISNYEMAKEILKYYDTSD